jgi:hypothetical protein
MNGQPCVICGARVRNPNQKVTTCSPFCTDAKKKGLTYAQAHELEARDESEIKPIVISATHLRPWQSPLDTGTRKLNHDVTE